MNKPLKRKASSWQGAVPNRDEQYNLKRNTLLREAAKAFGRDGFHNTSLDQIAATLGVSKPALYHYIKNKHEILYEVKCIVLEAGIKARAFASEKAKDPLDMIQMYIAKYIELIVGELGSFSILTEPITSLPPEYSNLLRTQMRKADSALRKMLEDAMESGHIKRIDTGLAVAFLIGALNHISRWHTPKGNIKIDEIGKLYAGLILNGLRGV